VKQFKQYLTELYGQLSMTDAFFNKRDFVPFTSWISKQLGIKNKRTIGYHIANLESLGDLIWLQGKNHSISTLTKSDIHETNFGDKVKIGITGKGGGILVELEGNIILNSDNELHSHVIHGQRWVSLTKLTDKSAYYLQEELLELKTNIVNRIMSKRNKNWIEIEDKFSLEYDDQIETLTGQDKKVIISEFMKQMVGFHKKFSGRYNLLNDPEGGYHNEIIMNKIKIKKVYIGAEYEKWREVQEWMEEKRIPYELVMFNKMKSKLK